MSAQLRTRSAAGTRALGEALGRILAAGGPACAILLSGDYGTGKTVFCSGLAAGLGISGPVRSPSYLIARVYPAGVRTFVHADLYRSGAPADIEELGLAELAGPQGVIAVEWPGEALPRLLALPTLSIAFTAGAGEDERELQVEWTPDFPRAAQEALCAAAH